MMHPCEVRCVDAHLVYDRLHRAVGSVSPHDDELFSRTCTEEPRAKRRTSAGGPRPAKPVYNGPPPEVTIYWRRRIGGYSCRAFDVAKGSSPPLGGPA
jgi:hypothetical protein